MTEKKSASNRFGMPTGKFLELSQKTNNPGPYEITDQLVVKPTTRGRRLKMADAERQILVGQAQLNISYSLSRVPAPPLPAPTVEPEAPKAPKLDGDDEAVNTAAQAQYEAAQVEYEAAKAAAVAEYKRDVEQWKREVQQWRQNLDDAQATITDHTEKVHKAEVEYDRAYFGDVYDNLIEFFDDQDENLWNDFVADLRKHWIPSQPDDDEENPGKDGKSSTG